MTKDLLFLAGDFLYSDFPSNRHYLLQYFSTEHELLFISYFLIIGLTLFNEKGFRFMFNNFSNHCGIRCQIQFIGILVKRYFELERLLDESMKNIDLERIAHIKSGSMLCKQLR